MQTNDAKQYQRFTYRSGTDGSEVVQYVLWNQGHAWPGGKKGYWRADEPSRLVAANDLMFEFFKLHPKKAAADSHTGRRRAGSVGPMENKKAVAGTARAVASHFVPSLLGERCRP